MPKTATMLGWKILLDTDTFSKAYMNTYGSVGMPASPKIVYEASHQTDTLSLMYNSPEHQD